MAGHHPNGIRGRVPTQAPTERCAYCGQTYPAPVSLHHTEEECAADGGPALHAKAAAPIGDAGVSVIPFDRAAVEAEPAWHSLDDGPAFRFLDGIVLATQTYGTEGTQLEIVVRPKAAGT